MHEFIQKLRSAGITDADDENTRLAKSLLVLASGLVSMASVVWLMLYWSLGPRLSSTLPFLFQLLLDRDRGATR